MGQDFNYSRIFLLAGGKVQAEYLEVPFIYTANFYNDKVYNDKMAGKPKREENPLSHMKRNKNYGNSKNPGSKVNVSLSSSSENRSISLIIMPAALPVS